MLVLPHTEDSTIVSSFIWTKHQNVTDRQTVRQPVTNSSKGAVISRGVYPPRGHGAFPQYGRMGSPNFWL